MTDKMSGWRVHLMSPDGKGNEVIVSVTDATADVLEAVLDRVDAAEALDYILSVPEGGPSCGCGGDHWSCDYDEASETEAILADPETMAAIAEGEVL